MTRPSKSILAMLQPMRVGPSSNTRGAREKAYEKVIEGVHISPVRFTWTFVFLCGSLAKDARKEWAALGLLALPEPVWEELKILEIAGFVTRIRGAYKDLADGSSS